MSHRVAKGAGAVVADLAKSRVAGRPHRRGRQVPLVADRKGAAIQPNLASVTFSLSAAVVIADPSPPLRVGLTMSSRWSHLAPLAREFLPPGPREGQLPH
jgi:hypothetical protein